MKKLVVVVLLIALPIIFWWGTRPKVALIVPAESGGEPPSSAVLARPAPSIVKDGVAGLVPPRAPSGRGEEGLSELQSSSSAPWSVRSDSRGMVTRLADGNINMGTSNAEEASAKFLLRFSQKLFGVSPASLALSSVRREEEGTQIVESQVINGLLVLNSSINLHFDRSGSLVYAVSEVYSGGDTPSASPAVEAAAAASLARSAVFQFLAKNGSTFTADEFPVAQVQGAGQLAYRLVAGHLSLVWRYLLPLHPVREDDLEILIDANGGDVVQVRSLSRR